MSEPIDPHEGSSPVCHASKADDVYMGYLAREELGDLLNTLLEAERAGARVGAGLVAAAPDAELKDLSRTIRTDEARWCAMLTGALKSLGIAASPRVGDFYAKATAIEDVDARLAFVNRGQAWVVRKLADTLPKVRDDALHASLKEMLDAHEHNIKLTEDALARRRAAAHPTPEHGGRHG
jgi:hypothetical protein